MVVCWQVKDYIPRNAILINEGSATMDIGRTVFHSHYPRRRSVNRSSLDKIGLMSQLVRSLYFMGCSARKTWHLNFL